VIGVLVAAAALTLEAAADRQQARSMVISRQGIVAAEQPLAAQAGASILAQGGNAVDAAVAANAALSVVAPMMCGMGGDLFALVYEAKTGKLHGFNGSGWSPARLTPEFLRGQGFKTMPQSGIHSVTVPGAVDGWHQLLARFGKLGFAQVLAPARQLAEEGFPVTEWVAGYWAACESLLKKDPAAAKCFLPGGRPPAMGEVFRNPDAAWSLEQVAGHGRSAFYDGAIGRRILELSGRLGGTLDAEDLRRYQGAWVEPISVNYRGWTVYEIPPNGQGIAALEMLNLMETFNLGEWGLHSANALHAMIEAKKLAYADLLRYIGDPAFGKLPVAGLLGKDYARQRAGLIDLSRAMAQAAPGSPPEPGNDTTYLCTVDQEGNLVSLIQSTYNAFGSGLVAEGAGFALQNRGGLFQLEAGHPNVLAGHKRPLHTIIPAFMSKGDIRIAFGIMGGWNQAQAHAQFVANYVDFKLNLQAALEAARFTKMSFTGTDVQLENRVPEAVRAELAARGHRLDVLPNWATSVGGGQAVLRDFARGVNYGASDPRKDGAAVPQPFLK
jgi:gamma-glutamyltranspeptidase/glutathione hydrolase